MLNPSMMSSKTDRWATPQNLFDALHKRFGFTLDVCADATNHKTPLYFDKATDGLAQSWVDHRFWMNPPYGRAIPKWVRKADETAQAGGFGVALIPARTDTVWWYDHVVGHEIWFIKGRLKFGNAEHGAPFPSALVIYGGVPGCRWVTAKDVISANRHA